MRKRFETLTSTETMNAVEPEKTFSFTDEQLDCLITTSMSFIGPIAKMLVKRHSKQAHSVEDLSLRLADHIESDDEKSTFIKNAKKCL